MMTKEIPGATSLCQERDGADFHHSFAVNCFVRLAHKHLLRQLLYGTIKLTTVLTVRSITFTRTFYLPKSSSSFFYERTCWRDSIEDDELDSGIGRSQHILITSLDDQRKSSLSAGVINILD
jgi:hypothetical protein